jgi:hypothetical protein
MNWCATLDPQAAYLVQDAGLEAQLRSLLPAPSQVPRQHLAQRGGGGSCRVVGRRDSLHSDTSRLAAATADWALCSGSVACGGHDTGSFERCGMAWEVTCLSSFDSSRALAFVVQLGGRQLGS